MCGICGVIAAEDGHAKGVSAEALTRRMLAAMHHRGPDDEGLLAASPVALGMRRLSIIDLSGGNQPIWNEARTVAVFTNGEIYNFRELRGTLESLGHRFQTDSDTEVIVHSYEEWGCDCPRRLHGMFAFAVLEMPAGPQGPPRQVFLARDRMGIKPLYYAQSNGAFLFASEVRALLASGIIPRRLSNAALESYLLFGSVCEPMTLVDGIYSLPPGHSLLLPVERPVPAPRPYWDVTSVANTKNHEHPPAAAPATELRSLLENSVRAHLIADVPLGIFLSSGLDSTALAALASRDHSGIHTLTVIFAEQDYSEAEMARRSAKRFHTQHSELLLTGEDMLARLEESVTAFDQPSADGVNSYFVSWAARQVGLKVALSGLGSDEIFGGYSTFRSTPQVGRLASFGRFAPSWLRLPSARAMQGIASRRGTPDSARKLASALRNPGFMPHGYFFTRALFTQDAVPFHAPLAENSAMSSAWRGWQSRITSESERLDPFSAVSWLELRSYMVNMLLRDTDSVSMSNSLEVRVPFLDHPLVEYVMRLPASAKQRGKTSKPLLVEALGDLLPNEVIVQRKRTFTFPWEKWLRGPLQARVQHSLQNLSPVLLSALDEHKVRNVWQDFLSGRTSWSRPWSLYMLNEWTRRHLETDDSRSAQAETASAASAV